MSDLQGALIVLGVLAVAAVAIYNQWQERQFRRKFDEALPPAQEDVLLPVGTGDDSTPDAQARPVSAEPVLQPGDRVDERRRRLARAGSRQPQRARGCGRAQRKRRAF